MQLAIQPLAIALSLDKLHHHRVHTKLLNLLCMCIYRNGYIFWTDTSRDIIYRAFINGSDPMMIVNTGLSCAGMYILFLSHSTIL